MHIFLPLNCLIVFNIRLLILQLLFHLYVFFKLKLVDLCLEIFYCFIKSYVIRSELLTILLWLFQLISPCLKCFVIKLFILFILLLQIVIFKLLISVCLLFARPKHSWRWLYLLLRGLCHHIAGIVIWKWDSSISIGLTLYGRLLFNPKVFTKAVTQVDEAFVGVLCLRIGFRLLIHLVVILLIHEVDVFSTDCTKDLFTMPS